MKNISTFGQIAQTSAVHRGYREMTKTFIYRKEVVKSDPFYNQTR